MNLTISYESPEGGNSWYVDVERSQSYKDVINEACVLWRNRLPPDEYIIGRYLARQITRHGTPQWARVSEARFTQIVQDTKEDLEFRLELDLQTGCHLHCHASTPSPLGMLNPCGAMSSLTSPVSLNDRHPNSILGRSTAVNLVPSIAESLAHQNHPPSMNRRATTRNATYETGLIAFFAGQFYDARTYFHLAANECHETGDTFQEAECLLRLGMTCRHLQDYPSAVSRLTSARTIYASLGACYQELLQCDRNLARVSEDQGNYQEALRTYQEVQMNAHALGMQTQEAWCDYSLGHLYNRMKQHDDALRYLSRAIRRAQSLNNQEIEAYATEESGRSAESQKNRELAIQCYEKALTIFKTRGREVWVYNENRVKKRLEHLGVKQGPKFTLFGKKRSAK